jgi:RNA polymerase sigma factor (TIGR02999 family)
MNEVTRILARIEEQGPQAAPDLLPLVYDELRQLAARLLALERPGQTLQPTALVHEAYLRLVDDPAARRWNSRRHFYAAAAEAMRRILIDAARSRGRLKRGGGRDRIELDAVAGEAAAGAENLSRDDLLALDEALAALAAEDPQKAELVKLRYFAGLELAEVADLLGISRATASRHWTFARAWLLERVEGSGAPSGQNIGGA